MTIDSNMALIEAYESLIESASRIVYFNNREYARIIVEENDEAVVVYPSAATDYDSCVIEQEQSRKFPAYLLDATDKEIETYKEELKKKDEQAHQEWLTTRQNENRQKELAQLDF